MKRLESSSISRLRAFLVTGFAAGLLSACASGGSVGTSTPQVDPTYGVAPSPRVTNAETDLPRGGGRRQVGRTYTIAGRTYEPRHQPNLNQTGTASWYGDEFHGRLTANGEIYDMTTLSAAHPTLPLPSYVRVTNLANNNSVVVRVNDRGPFHGNRIIDLSRHAADVLDMRHAGLGRVRVEYVGEAPLHGEDVAYLESTISVNGRAPANDVMLAAAAPPPAPVASPIAYAQPVLTPPLVVTAAPGQVVDAVSVSTPLDVPAASGEPLDLTPVSVTSPRLASITVPRMIGYAPMERIEGAHGLALDAAAQMATGAVALSEADAVSGDVIVIQAGLFAVASNAERAIARLAGFGRVESHELNGMTSVQVIVDGANALASVQAAGFSDAYIAR